MKLCKRILWSELPLVRYSHNKNFSPKSTFLQNYCHCAAQNWPIVSKLHTTIAEETSYKPPKAQVPQPVRHLVIIFLPNGRTSMFKINYVTTLTGPISKSCGRLEHAYASIRIRNKIRGSSTGGTRRSLQKCNLTKKHKKFILKIGRRFWYQTIRLGELNRLLFLFCSNRWPFGGKLKKTFFWRGVLIHKKFNLKLKWRVWYQSIRHHELN